MPVTVLVRFYALSLYFESVAPEVLKIPRGCVLLLWLDVDLPLTTTSTSRALFAERRGQIWRWLGSRRIAKTPQHRYIWNFSFSYALWRYIQKHNHETIQKLHVSQFLASDRTFRIDNNFRTLKKLRAFKPSEYWGKNQLNCKKIDLLQ